MTEAFYVPDGAGFVATVHTRGPWSPTHQHGGPPSALMARAIEAQVPGFVIARITVDFLLPVPIDRLVVSVETLRAGSKVQRLVARLRHGDRVVAQALAALVRPTGVAIVSPTNDPALLPPEAGRPFEFPFFDEPVSYHEAMETRLVRGEWGSGRVAAWMRQRMPLVAGTPTSPLERVLVAADSGSGVSAAIDHERVTAINADLTVSVHRALQGEWVGMDSLSIYEPHGVGLADTRLHDVRGPIGRALQSLLVEARG
jgi:Acyl-CoA thioesterase C-terminal domain/Acyl-CoA thioesterase N-terminal domain